MTATRRCRCQVTLGRTLLGPPFAIPKLSRGRTVGSGSGGLAGWWLVRWRAGGLADWRTVWLENDPEVGEADKPRMRSGRVAPVGPCALP